MMGLSYQIGWVWVNVCGQLNQRKHGFYPVILNNGARFLDAGKIYRQSAFKAPKPLPNAML
jgi:hypothetical protein